MAGPPALPCMGIDLSPHDRAAAAPVATRLVTATGSEMISLFHLTAGQHKPARRVYGEVTVQCLRGRVAVAGLGATRELVGGQSLHLAGGERYALSGVEDSTVLVTVVLRPLPPA